MAPPSAPPGTSASGRRSTTSASCWPSHSSRDRRGGPSPRRAAPAQPVRDGQQHAPDRHSRRSLSRGSRVRLPRRAPRRLRPLRAVGVCRPVGGWLPRRAGHRVLPRIGRWRGSSASPEARHLWPAALTLGDALEDRSSSMWRVPGGLPATPRVFGRVLGGYARWRDGRSPRGPVGAGLALHGRGLRGAGRFDVQHRRPATTPSRSGTTISPSHGGPPRERELELALLRSVGQRRSWPGNPLRVGPGRRPADPRASRVRGGCGRQRGGVRGHRAVIHPVHPRVHRLG